MLAKAPSTELSFSYKYYIYNTVRTWKKHKIVIFFATTDISPFYNFPFSQSYRTRILERIISFLSVDSSRPLRYSRDTTIRPARPSVISGRTLIPTFIPAISAGLISDLWGRNGEVMPLLTKSCAKGKC